MAPPEAVRVALAAASAVCDGSEPSGSPGAASSGGAASEARVDDPFADFTARGHRIQTNGPFLFCMNCGSYSGQRLGPLLKGVCRQRMAKGAKAALDLILDGKHPVSKVPFLSEAASQPCLALASGEPVGPV